jgi:hypothetical protein
MRAVPEGEVALSTYLELATAAGRSMLLESDLVCGKSQIARGNRTLFTGAKLKG